MGKVIQLNRKKVFKIEEARELLPLVRRITEEASQRVSGHLSVLEAIREKDSSKAKDLEDKVNKLITDWQTKIEKLGAEGKGLWLVDFDCGNGYYCWKFPEEKLDHFHSYSEGFQARVKIPPQDVVRDESSLLEY